MGKRLNLIRKGKMAMLCFQCERLKKILNKLPSLTPCQAIDKCIFTVIAEYDDGDVIVKCEMFKRAKEG